MHTSAEWALDGSLRVLLGGLDRVRGWVSSVPDESEDMPRAVPRGRSPMRDRGRGADDVVTRSNAVVLRETKPLTHVPKQESPKEYAAKVNRVLDKISQQGIESLTKDERRILRNVRSWPGVQRADLSRARGLRRVDPPVSVIVRGCQDQSSSRLRQSVPDRGYEPQDSSDSPRFVRLAVSKRRRGLALRKGGAPTRHFRITYFRRQKSRAEEVKLFYEFRNDEALRARCERILMIWWRIMPKWCEWC